MITAIILAAGLSTRMGRPKMILPWGETTVIGHVVATYIQAGIDGIVVVTGASHMEVEAAVSEGSWKMVRTVYNPRYTEDDMLVSLRAGMAVLGDEVDAMLVGLGDQPQIEADVVRSLVELYLTRGAPLIVPSYHLHRGHPWLVHRSLWPTLLSAPPGSTMRDFLHACSQQITYLTLDTATIISDLDTPEDYARLSAK
jgi:molybdenum cofactor cytidylyltransferase